MLVNATCCVKNSVSPKKSQAMKLIKETPCLLSKITLCNKGKLSLAVGTSVLGEVVFSYTILFIEIYKLC